MLSNRKSQPFIDLLAKFYMSPPTQFVIVWDFDTNDQLLLKNRETAQEAINVPFIGISGFLTFLRADISTVKDGIARNVIFSDTDPIILNIVEYWTKMEANKIAKKKKANAKRKTPLEEISKESKKQPKLSHDELQRKLKKYHAIAFTLEQKLKKLIERQAHP